MRIVRKRLDRALGWARRRARRPREAHGIVLMYHRVAMAPADPWNLCVAPENFESQVRALREDFDLVPLVELRGRLRRGRRSRPVAAITFDDGYFDNLSVAKPILERHHAPATVFAITGLLGDRKGFWWDRLTHAILSTSALPPTLGLEAATGRFDWQDPELDNSDARGATARRRLHDRLWEWLCDQPVSERADVLENLERWAGHGSGPGPHDRPMTADELRALAAGGLVDVGVHTATHPRLSRLPSAAKAHQIERSRSDCRSILGRDPSCFSYPNGDHDAESIELVRRAGFALACDSRQDLVWDDGDPHVTPRISAPDVSGRALVRRLRWEWLA